MIRIDLRQTGAGYHVEVHQMHCVHHGRCECEPEEHASARAYPQRGDTPREERAAVMSAVQAALRSWGHLEFLHALGDDDRLL